MGCEVRNNTALEFILKEKGGENGLRVVGVRALSFPGKSSARTALTTQKPDPALYRTSQHRQNRTVRRAQASRQQNMQSKQESRPEVAFKVSQFADVAKRRAGKPTGVLVQAVSIRI